MFSKSDNLLLQKCREARFAEVIADPSWYNFKVENNVLLLEALHPCWVNAAICGFNELLDAAYLILGCESISLYCAEEWIADYTKKKVTATRVFSMTNALLEKEITEAVQTPQEEQNLISLQQNTEYISLHQLREMAVALSGENEEFIAWMESNDITIPMRFMNGTPYFQKKAIAKAAEQWNNSKIQVVLSRYLGMPVSTVAATPKVQPQEASSNGVSPTPKATETLKLLRTPSGFKAIKGGKDRYIKTIRALAEAVPSERWPQYLQHILEQDELGTGFLNRIAKQFDSSDAFAKLLEAAQEFATENQTNALAA